MLFRGYPYKTCPNKKRTATVKAKEMIHDHEFSLTQGQWGEILTVYFEYLFEYLIRGYEYAIPVGWLGKLSLIKKTKTVTIDSKATQELEQVVRFKNKWINGYGVQLNWWNKKFMFQSIWKIRFMPTLGKAIYHRLMENPSFIYRMNNARRTNRYR